MTKGTSSNWIGDLLDYLQALVKNWVLTLLFVLDVIGALINYRLLDSAIPQYVFWGSAGIVFILANFQVYREIKSELPEEILPELQCRLFNPNVMPRTFGDILEYFTPEQGSASQEVFGIAIQNSEADSVAHELVLTISIFWSGSPPKTAIKFYPPRSEGWQAGITKIYDKQAAQFSFRGSESHRVPYRQDLFWDDFRFQLHDGLVVRQSSILG